MSKKRICSGKIFSVFLLVALLSGVLSACSVNSDGTETGLPQTPDAVLPETPVATSEVIAPATPELTPVQTVAPTPKPAQTVTLNFAGDLLMHETLLNLAKKADGVYDFSNLYTQIGPMLSKADFTVANLETTLAGKEAGYGGWPRFNTPESFTETMRHILGIDLLMTANNHCMDKGVDGLKNTLQVLDGEGLLHTGTYATNEAANTPQVVEVNGIRMAFLNYTYSLNQHEPPSGYEYVANRLELEKIQADAKAAREAGAEYIFCLPHWGVEHSLTESDTQRTQAEWIFANTEVDMIVGGHPHVVQPAEYMTVTTADGTEKTGFVLYSLGNFTSSHSPRREYADTGIVLHVSLKKDAVTGQVNAETVSYTPVVLDYTPGAVTDNAVVTISQALYAYDAGVSTTVTETEARLFREYQTYYAKIFAGVMEQSQ